MRRVLPGVFVASIAVASGLLLLPRLLERPTHEAAGLQVTAEAEPESVERIGAPSAANAPEDTLSRAAEEGTRRVIASTEPEPIAAPEPDPRPEFDALLVDPSGHPLAELAYETPEGESKRSDREGRARFIGGESAALNCDFGEWYAVLVGTGAAHGHDRGPLVVLAPVAHVDLQVLDPEDQPAAGAYVNWQAHGLLRSYPYPIQVARESNRANRAEPTDANGRLGLGPVPGGMPLDITARSADGLRGRLRLDRPGEGPAVLRLEAPRIKPGEGVHVSGRVLDVLEQPVVSARVMFLGQAFEETITDEQGRFGLSVGQFPGAFADYALVASHPEHGLARVEDLHTRVGDAWPDAPAEIVMRLGGPANSLQGRVVLSEPIPSREEGGALLESAAGWHVSVVDPSVHGFFATPMSALEGPDLRAVTNAQGRFALRTLDPTRAYHLFACSPNDEVGLVAGPFTPGGGEVTIDVDPGAFVSQLNGRVVGTLGTPVEGVRVAAALHSLRMVTDGGARSTSSWEATSTLTDAEGRFRLQGVPRRGAYLSVRGTDEQIIAPAEFQLDDLDLAGEPVLRVSRMLPVIFDLGRPLPPSDAHHSEMLCVRVHDGQGTELPMLWFNSGIQIRGTPLDPRALQTAHVYVSDRAVEAEMLGHFERGQWSVLERASLDLSLASPDEPLRVFFTSR